MLSFDVISSKGRSSSHSNPTWVLMSLIVSVSVAVSQTFNVFSVVSFASRFRCVRKCFARSDILSKFRSMLFVEICWDWLLFVEICWDATFCTSVEALCVCTGVVFVVVWVLFVVVFVVVVVAGGMVVAITCGLFVLVAMSVHVVGETGVVLVMTVGAVFITSAVESFLL